MTTGKKKTGRPSKGPREALTVRIAPDLVEKLKEDADKNTTTVNGLIEWILKKRYKGAPK